MSLRIEPEVVRAARDGAPQSVEALVAAVWPFACRLAHAVLGDRASAEDVAQDAVFAMIRGLCALRDEERFVPWFTRTVVRTALRARRIATAELTERADPAGADPIASAADRLDVSAAAARLSRRERAVLYLAASGYTSREIGGLMRMVAGTARVVLFTARKKLRAGLAAPAAPRASRKEVRVP